VVWADHDARGEVVLCCLFVVLCCVVLCDPMCVWVRRCLGSAYGS